eukprot:bmy_13153T0
MVVLPLSLVFIVCGRICGLLSSLAQASLCCSARAGTSCWGTARRDGPRHVQDIASARAGLRPWPGAPVPQRHSAACSCSRRPSPQP